MEKWGEEDGQFAHFPIGKSPPSKKRIYRGNAGVEQHICTPLKSRCIPLRRNRLPITIFGIHSKADLRLFTTCGALTHGSEENPIIPDSWPDCRMMGYAHPELRFSKIETDSR
jgi:hypothetical protein